jgi:acyl carrier protein
MQVRTVSEQIRGFVIKHFPLARKHNIHNNDPLLVNGIIDSLGILEIIGYLEKEFKISVADEELVPENFDTIESIAAFVQQKNHSNLG